MEVSLWTFVRVEGIEPTNNNAARPLRRAVLWRRKSYGTQSESGSRFVERLNLFGAGFFMISAVCLKPAASMSIINESFQVQIY
jgi:hypothetical protein